MKKLFDHLVNLGVSKTFSRSENKITKLLNIICITWIILIGPFILKDFLTVEQYIPTAIGHLVMGTFLVTVLFLQKNQKTNTARLLFIITSFGDFYIFSNYLMVGKLAELFYLLTPLFSILMFKQKWIHYTFLVISILFFIIPNQFTHIYNETLFVDPADPAMVPIFFVCIFLMVIYFKNINLKNEMILEDQKNKAEEATQTINNQKHELENLHHHQKQFFVNVAHEIRTPLTIINGNNNIIATNHEPQESTIIKDQVTKIQQIVDDVLDLAKLDTNDFVLQKTTLDIGSLISQIKDSFNASFKSKHIEFNLINNAKSTVFVSADNRYLQRALNNLLSNALKYTPEKGNVSIQLKTNEEVIELAISDTGIGIKEDEKRLIFNRFYQVDNSINKAGGSGIGLAFTKEIIELHGGTIKTKHQNIGSCFVIDLPIIEENIITNVKTSNPTIKRTTPSILPGNKQILVVEDNIDMAKYITTILMGYKVIHAKDGLEALEILQKNIAIDLIITDYMMPHLNGYDFIVKLREKENNTPVIMLTAKSDITTKIKVLRLGIDDVISKPFEAEELLIRVNKSIVNNESKIQFIKEENISPSETNENSWINTMILFIETNCTDSTLTVSTLCDEFAVSSSTLFRKVKCHTGLGTKEFITEVRLRKAKNLLINSPSISFTEMAYETGFKNVTRFKNLYIERFG